MGVLCFDAAHFGIVLPDVMGHFPNGVAKEDVAHLELMPFDQRCPQYQHLVFPQTLQDVHDAVTHQGLRVRNPQLGHQDVVLLVTLSIL